MSAGQFVRGLGIGAAVMYLLDPERGRRRRAAVRDRAAHLVHQADDAAGKTARDARNRARGLIAGAAARLRRDEVDDRVLVERVRSAIGRVASHPASLEVSAQNGQIRLGGVVLERERTRIIAAVEAVRGVRDVVDRLDTRVSAEGVPGLRGGTAREPRFELRQRHWSPTARLLTGVGGATIALYGRRLPPPLRQVTTVLGAGLAARAVTNLETRRLLGVDAGRRAVDVQKTIEIAAPVEDVFAFWSRFDNFPRFMSHLREVRRTGDRTSHWVAEGPGGARFHWDAEVTELEENRRIAWRSTPGASVENAGVVRFDPTPEGGTRVDIRLSYNPPAGALGHGVASLLGVDPKHAMHEDLVRFKSLMEEGRATAHGHTVERQELAEGTQPSA